MRKILLTLLFTMLFISPVVAVLAGNIKTVTLDVEKMTCGMCPVTVKKALQKIEGVTEVVAKYEGEGNGWATITYDADKTAIEDLTFATEAAGYPSRLKP